MTLAALAHCNSSTGGLFSPAQFRHLADPLVRDARNDGIIRVCAASAAGGQSRDRIACRPFT